MLLPRTLERESLKEKKSPGWSGSVEGGERPWASQPKGRLSDSQSGHKPGLWNMSPFPINVSLAHLSDVPLPPAPAL